MTDSKGKVGKALVTGASTGIGAVYADRLAKRGYDLILVARDVKRMESLAVKLKEITGRNIDVVGADLTDRKDLLKIEDILQSDSKISMLVNNAAYADSTAFAEAKLDDLENMIALNITAVTRLSNAAAKSFITRKSGSIINIGSGVVMMPEMVNAVYGGSKAYILHFTRNIAVQLAPHGIRTQVVLPGAIFTEAWARSGTDITMFAPETIMSAEDLVDASLAGFDRGETISFPSVSNLADWNSMERSREALIPQIFSGTPAPRYK